MGLTLQSSGTKAMNSGSLILNTDDKVIALAGNPNVGKSTVFNELTGLNQHTGNWPGKTVVNAQGSCFYEDTNYTLVDIPGTYSLMAHSAEEEVARDFLCFGKPDAVIVVCDATCMERNLNLVLQTIEMTDRVVVCVNLMDEAEKKRIRIDLGVLSKRLGVPVTGASARSKKGLDELMRTVVNLFHKPQEYTPVSVRYDDEIETAVSMLMPALKEKLGDRVNPRWLALRLLENDEKLIESVNTYLAFDILADDEIRSRLESARAYMTQKSISVETLKDKLVCRLVQTAEEICRGVVLYEKQGYQQRDRKIDKILTSRWTGVPVMLALLTVVFWLTLNGANYPSQLLSGLLFSLEDKLAGLLILAGAPPFVYGMLAHGVYRVLAWVISVMLPPMAIFFPLFTLLEDLGYLTRVAFNLDKYFKKCCACGKQALTMCMGFGCNAAGIVGCRIIDSPRERLIAMITNNFVPCNGRFPTLIAVITMFFTGYATGFFRSVLSALMLTGIVVLGVGMTFVISRLLSQTMLKGQPSSFTLELPPYRRPQIGKVIVRSILDRTLFVLGRAVLVAAPAGLVIWLLANINVGGITLLTYCAEFLDPFARLFGLDGVILLAFILGIPANEIVIPIIIMAYMSTGNIIRLDSLVELKDLLVTNGWTWITAISMMLFSLMHWPCSTTFMTIRKETYSWKWAAVSFAVPTITGFTICFLFAGIARMFL